MLFLVSLPLVLGYQNCASSGLVASTPVPHNICEPAFQNCFQHLSQSSRAPAAQCSRPEKIAQLGGIGRVSCHDSCEFDEVNKIHLVPWRSDVRGDLLDLKGVRADNSVSKETDYFRCVASTCDANHSEAGNSRCVVKWVAHHDSNPYNKGDADAGDRCMKDESGKFMTALNMDPTSTPYRFSELPDQKKTFFCYKNKDAACTVGSQ